MPRKSSNKIHLTARVDPEVFAWTKLPEGGLNVGEYLTALIRERESTFVRARARLVGELGVRRVTILAQAIGERALSDAVGLQGQIALFLADYAREEGTDLGDLSETVKGFAPQQASDLIVVAREAAYGRHL